MSFKRKPQKAQSKAEIDLCDCFNNDWIEAQLLEFMLKPRVAKDLETDTFRTKHTRAFEHGGKNF